MTSKTPNFNLIEEEWLPVLYRNGETRRVGIKQCLLEAGSILQVATSNPLDQVGVVRFLLTILQWCKPSPADDEIQELESANGIPSEWLKKLDDDPDIFNFLGAGQRFLQHAVNTGKLRPVADLFHELPGGTNIAHFRHVRDYRDGVCLACAAIGFIRLPIAMTISGRGKKTRHQWHSALLFRPVRPNAVGNNQT